MGFGLYDRQNKQFEDVTMSSETFWWYFLSLFFISYTKQSINRLKSLVAALVMLSCLYSCQFRLNFGMLLDMEKPPPSPWNTSLKWKENVSHNVLPFLSDAPHSGEFVQAPPLPVIHFPFRMSAHHPSGYVPYPNLLLNVPWFPPVPVGLYNDVLRGPLMFPHFQPGAAHHHPPPPEPGPPAVSGCSSLL